MEMVRKLERIHKNLAQLAKQGTVEGFLKNVWNAERLGGLLEDVRDAMMEYQVCLAKPPLIVVSDGKTRHRYNKISMTRVVGSL